MSGARNVSVNPSPAPWPPSSGEMAQRIREYDWTATPLGPTEGWSARFRLMVETVLISPQVSSLVCEPGLILIYNDAAARLYGTRHPIALGRPLPETFPEGWATVAPFYARAFAGEAVLIAGQSLDTRGEAHSIDIFDAMLVPIRDDTGVVTSVHMTGWEVGARLRTEAALLESEQSLRTLMEGIPQLVWRSGDAGQWSWVGRQWTSYTGLSDVASLGEGWLAAVHPDDHGTVAEAWRLAGETGQFEADYRIRSAADGAWRWFQTRGARIRGESGVVAEWLGTSTDIDDQMQARELLTRGKEELETRVAERTAKLMAAEEAVRQLQKMEAVGQLTGGIAHDFNNMLQGVGGSVDMARLRIASGRLEEAERYLSLAGEAIDRAAGLTRRLLAFARRQRLDPKLVDPDALIAEMADLIRRTMGPSVEVDLQLRDGAGLVQCDPNELENVLLNLCINARDAMPQGGRLTIGTEDILFAAEEIPEADAEPGWYVAIMVADTGTGMAPEVLQQMFDPFFTTKPAGQGTGLGLSQVYGFVRQSGGLVRVESTPGQGSTFRLLLPFIDRAELDSEPQAEPVPVQRPTGPRGTVLLVDDEDTVRTPAAERLREFGFHTLEARDGAGALRILATARPDLLVTDLGLPGGMNGQQIAEAARQRIPELPVLFVSGFVDVPLPHSAEVVIKPFTLEALVQRVQSILAGGVGR